MIKSRSLPLIFNIIAIISFVLAVISSLNNNSPFFIFLMVLGALSLIVSSALLWHFTRHENK